MIYFINIIPYALMVVYSLALFISGLSFFGLWYFWYWRKKRGILAHELITCCALENAADFLLIINAEGIVEVCNKEFEIFIGIERNEIIGKELQSLLPEEVGAHLTEIEQRVRTSGGKICLELVLRSLAGDSFDCEAIITCCAESNAVLYVFRDIREQNRTLSALVKRDKLLYDLSCGTQKILNNSMDFDQALESALQKFCIGAEVDAVIMAQTVSPEDCGYNVGHKVSIYRFSKAWSSCCRLDEFTDCCFEIRSNSILNFESVLEQEKIVFIPAESINLKTDSSGSFGYFAGFYATAINCQGMNWGILLLGSKEIKEKWSDETEDVIEITALQFGVLLERRKAEQSLKATVKELKRSQRRFNLALEIAGAASFEYDLFLDKFDIDSTFARILKYDSNWSITNLEEMKSIIHEEDIERWHTKISALLNGDYEVMHDDIRMKMSGGKYLWVTMISSILVENDVICGLSGVFQDIEDKIVSKNRLLNAEKVAAGGELCTVIADKCNLMNRDLRQKLSLLLNEGKLPRQEDKELLRVIIQELHNTSDIAGQLVNLSVADYSAAHLLRVNLIIEDVAGMIQNEFATCGINLRLKLTPDLPQIFANSADLINALINILLSIKEDLIASGCKFLFLTSAMAGEMVQLRIMPDERYVVNENFREALFQADSDNYGKIAGAGLKLSVSQLLIRKYGGEILLNTRDRGETEFILQLPVVLSENTIDELLPIDEE